MSKYLDDTGMSYFWQQLKPKLHGNDIFIVEFYSDAMISWDGTLYTATTDKTFAEVQAAVRAGKIVMARLVEDDDGDMAMLPLAWFYDSSSSIGSMYVFQGSLAYGYSGSMGNTHIATAQINISGNAQIAIKQLPLSGDYIVYQGTSGDFFYRKWNSGYAEVDYKKSFTDISVSSQSGGIYYGSITTSQNFPFAFTEIPCVSISSGGSTNTVWVWLAAKVTTTKFPNCYVGRGTSKTGVSINFSAHITGKWK